MLLLDRLPNKHVIAGLLNIGLGSDRFWARNPPRISFSKSRFQLWDCSRKLFPEHVVSLQWTVATDLFLIYNLRTHARFSANVKLNPPPALGSTKSVPWDGALLLALTNNISQRMI
jgi:hypothetical protein